MKHEHPLICPVCFDVAEGPDGLPCTSRCGPYAEGSEGDEVPMIRVTEFVRRIRNARFDWDASEEGDYVLTVNGRAIGEPETLVQARSMSDWMRQSSVDLLRAMASA